MTDLVSLSFAELVFKFAALCPSSCMDQGNILLVHLSVYVPFPSTFGSGEKIANDGKENPAVLGEKKTPSRHGQYEIGAEKEHRPACFGPSRLARLSFDSLSHFDLCLAHLIRLAKLA
ncbi:uncharacterized protein ARMOST_02882 [Armillaria ostoyae]|uniref:Uncharacterized protein n=1 Tax=Armillaria ostoyae TaxID=47428 RepID=A0A284QSV7_ARMOS|nr:uncharacterized protein ARMOST_02882 [Armillaria ostoyae]